MPGDQPPRRRSSLAGILGLGWLALTALVASLVTAAAPAPYMTDVESGRGNWRIDLGVQAAKPSDGKALGYPAARSVLLVQQKPAVSVRLLIEQISIDLQDEIFHIPQAREYCLGRFAEWDPKITTPPLLYLAGAAYGQIAWYGQSLISTSDGEKAWQDQVCSTAALRSLNPLLASACAVLMYLTYLEVHPQATSRDAMLMAAAMSLTPLHFFFAFLFYTDVLSTLLVVASYLAVLKRLPTLSGLICIAAMATRQTNAVWAAFNLGVGVYRRLRPQGSRAEGKDEGGVMRQIPRLAAMAWQLKAGLLREFWALVLSLAAFAVFLAWNGGVVLGDKSNHVSVFHPTQLLYLCLYVSLVLAPVHWVPSRAAAMAAKAAQALRSRPSGALLIAGLAAGLMLCSVHFFTLVHPFTLADNRHYMFYIWRRVFARHAAIRYVMVAPYLYSSASILDTLGRQQSGVWVLMLCICSAAMLIPAWLVELRYFTVPLVHTMLHMEMPSGLQQFGLVAMFSVINIATIALFANHAYKWEDGTVARFMW